jgi:hypothetical protein
MKRESTKDWSEVIKNFAQIIAIIIAGFWTYHLFKQKDAPGLEIRGAASTNLSWSKLRDTDNYLVDFYATIKNEGTSSFDVSKIHVQAWEFASDTQKERLNYIDPEIIRSGQPFFEKTYQLNETSSSVFPSHYPPGAEHGNSFGWTLKPDCKKWMLFATDFYLKGEDNAPRWMTYVWWQECPPAE